MANRRMIVPSSLVVILFFAGAVAVMVLVVDFLTGSKKDDTDAETRAEQHHTALWEACTRYAADHSGEYPASLAVLVAGGYADEPCKTYVGRRGVSLEILYQAPTATATEDTILLYDNRPTFVNLYSHAYVEGTSNVHDAFAYATTVGGLQEYVPIRQIPGYAVGE